MKGLASAKRVSWGVGDQALSSLTNFLIGILVARSVGVEEFGAFSLAFAFYVIALLVARALTGEPLVVRHNHAADDEWRTASAGAGGLAVVVALAASGVALVLAVLTRGSIGGAFVALAIVLPGLLVQDVWRYAFVARSQPRLAFACDLVWAVVLIPGLILVGSGTDTSLAWPILVWGGSALVSAAAGMAMARLVPNLRLARAWFRESRDLGLRYTTEALVSVAPLQITLYALGIFAGLSATAGLRGAQLLLGPIQMLLIGISMVGVPEGANILRGRGPRAMYGPAAALSAAVALFTLLWGTVLTLLPASVGEMLLGQSWADAQAVLPPVTLWYVGVMLGLGSGIGLRTLADAGRSLRARFVDATGQLAGGVTGAWLGAATGAAVGLAFGGWIGMAASWVMLRAAVRAWSSRVAARGQVDGPPMEEPVDRASPEQNGARTHQTIDL